MSFRRRRRRPLKRTFRRGRRTLRGIRRNRNTRLSITKRVAKMERQIEKKTFSSFLGTAFPEVGQVTSYYLQGLSVGTSDSNRIGKKVSVQSLQFNFNIRANDAQTLTALVRVLLVRDKQNRAVIPPIDDATNGILDSLEMVSLRKSANFSRYDIVRDATFQIPKHGERGSNIKFTWFLKLKGRRSQFEWLNSTLPGNGVSKGGIGAWYLYIIHDTSDANEGPTLKTDYRVRFTDA